jgi:hypothetical protein
MAAGAHSHSKSRVLQPEIANHLTTAKKPQIEQESLENL